IALVADVHDTRAALVPDIGDVGSAADEERVDALRGESAVDLPHLRADGHPIAGSPAAHLDRLGRVADRHDEFCCSGVHEAGLVCCSGDHAAGLDRRWPDTGAAWLPTPVPTLG